MIEQLPFIQILTVFILAIFVGFEVITKVPPILHTPLMSGSNAISGITIIGALLAAVLFIFGLKGLSHPKTAVRGNIYGAVGMLVAILVTLAANEILSFQLILLGLLIGTLIGAVIVLKIKMTAMPQMVGLFNGFGGLASAMVAGAVLYQVTIDLAAGSAGDGKAMFEALVTAYKEA